MQELQRVSGVRDERGVIRAAPFVHLQVAMTLNSSDPLTGITEQIIGAAIDVHRELGPGLLESAYQACLEHELVQRQVDFRRQVAVPLLYKGVHVDCGYRADMLVEERVIVEVKSVERIAPVHVAQVITYLKLKGCPVGLLLNFNVTSMRQGIRRIANRSLEEQGDHGDRGGKP